MNGRTSKVLRRYAIAEDRHHRVVNVRAARRVYAALSHKLKARARQRWLRGIGA